MLLDAVGHRLIPTAFVGHPRRQDLYLPIMIRNVLCGSSPQVELVMFAHSNGSP